MLISSASMVNRASPYLLECLPVQIELCDEVLVIVLLALS
jgi:hypothetical protein